MSGRALAVHWWPPSSHVFMLIYVSAVGHRGLPIREEEGVICVAGATFESVASCTEALEWCAPPPSPINMHVCMRVWGC
jgi:hypothetical protein